MSSSTNSMRIAEIFTQAGLAFNKLGELTMTLANNSNSGSASKWSDAEIAMLRDAVSRFGRDLHKLTEVLRNKSVAQIRNQLRRKEFKEAGFSDPGDLPSIMSPLKKEPESGDKLESAEKTHRTSDRRRRAPVLGRKQLPPQKRRKVSPSNVHGAEDDDEDDEEEDDEDEDENPPGISTVAASSEVGLSSSLGSLPPPIVTMSNRPSSSAGPARPPLRKQMGSLISRQPIIDEEEEDDEDDEDDEDEEEEGMDDEADTEPGYGTSNLASPSENAGLRNQQAVSDIEEDDDLGEELDEEDIDVKEEEDDDDEEEGEDYLVDEDDESEDGIEDEENLNM